jgi:hypothetical protein
LARRRDANVKWSAWTVYYVGRGFELAGLFVVTAAMILFFGTSEMRPMLAVTGGGGALFFIGWLMARKNPEEK